MCFFSLLPPVPAGHGKYCYFCLRNMPLSTGAYTRALPTHLRDRRAFALHAALPLEKKAAVRIFTFHDPLHGFRIFYQPYSGTQMGRALVGLQRAFAKYQRKGLFSGRGRLRPWGNGSGLSVSALFERLYERISPKWRVGICFLLLILFLADGAWCAMHPNTGTNISYSSDSFA